MALTLTCSSQERHSGFPVPTRLSFSRSDLSPPWSSILHLQRQRRMRHPEETNTFVTKWKKGQVGVMYWATTRPLLWGTRIIRTVCIRNWLRKQSRAATKRLRLGGTGRARRRRGPWRLRRERDARHRKSSRAATWCTWCASGPGSMKQLCSLPFHSTKISSAEKRVPFFRLYLLKLPESAGTLEHQSWRSHHSQLLWQPGCLDFVKPSGVAHLTDTSRNLGPEIQLSHFVQHLWHSHQNCCVKQKPTFGSPQPCQVGTAWPELRLLCSHRVLLYLQPAPLLFESDARWCFQFLPTTVRRKP